MGGIVATVLVVGVASAVVPRLSAPQDNIKALADKISFGPRSSEEAQKMKVELDNALLEFLKKNGSLPSADLLTKLQAKLPTSIFEVLVFDLPRGIKLVEVDCVLQPSDYLVIADKQAPKVTQIYGLDVFDDASLIKDSAGDALVLIGHTNVDMKKKPNMKVISLFPNGNVVDRTTKLVPRVKGNGAIAFESNKKDIKLERRLVETALAEGLFKGNLKFVETPFITTLTWNNGRYEAEHSLGSDRFSALYAVATSLAEPTEVDNFKSYLNEPARTFLKSLADNSVVGPPGFVIAKMEETKGQSSGRRSRRRHAPASDQVTYSIASGKRTFSVVLSGGNGRRWTAASVEETAPEAPSETVADVAPVKKKVIEVATVDRKSAEKQAKQEREKADAAEKRLAGKKAADRKASERKAEEARKIAEEKQAAKEKKAAAAKKETESKKVGSAAAGGEFASTPKRVTVRTGPGAKYGKVIVTSRGQKIKVLGKQDGWYKVSVDGKVGYAWSGLVKYDKADAYTTAVVRKTKPVNDSGKKVSTAKAGDKLVIIGGLKNDKYKVRMANGKTGFVEKDAVDVAVEEPTFVP
ncbi:MAG: SH3 domain-containing protein [Candidatus Obscuribacterales bacterium]|nr:SH3 domain-containing protein [Candidatus Obscuribacterales bacterium]